MELQVPGPLEALSKSGAVLLASIYAAGFLIVVLHHAEYGIAEFNPLKPKIFSAGILFALLFLVPAVAAYRWYVPSAKLKADSTDQAQSPSWMILSPILNFYFVSLGVAQPWGFLFGAAASEPLKGVSWWAVLLFIVIVTGLILITKRYLKQRALASLFVSALLVAGVFTAELRYGNRIIFWLALWFYFVGAVTILFYRGVLSLERMKQIEWERLVPALLILPLSIYATKVYGKIKPSYGGGMPTPVVLHFSGKNPMSESAETRVLLIDETDHGYYVLRNMTEKKSYFVRRDTVIAVVFERAE